MFIEFLGKEIDFRFAPKSSFNVSRIDEIHENGENKKKKKKRKTLIKRRIKFIDGRVSKKKTNICHYCEYGNDRQNIISLLNRFILNHKLRKKRNFSSVLSIIFGSFGRFHMNEKERKSRIETQIDFVKTISPRQL